MLFIQATTAHPIMNSELREPHDVTHHDICVKSSKEVTPGVIYGQGMRHNVSLFITTVSQINIPSLLVGWPSLHYPARFAASPTMNESRPSHLIATPSDGRRLRI